VPIAESLHAFDILVQNGKVRYTGAKIRNRRIESYRLEISLHAREAQTGRIEKDLP
jgi:aryl-alcohol dehydrogenase-like predicted oxidoreductase